MFPYKVNRLQVSFLTTKIKLLGVRKSGDIFRLNSTAIRGGPISGFWLLSFLVFSVKKGCQHGKSTLRNLCMQSTSCGLD